MCVSLRPLGAGSAVTSGLIPKGRLVLMLSRGRLADFPGGRIQVREAVAALLLTVVLQHRCSSTHTECRQITCQPANISFLNVQLMHAISIKKIIRFSNKLSERDLLESLDFKKTKRCSILLLHQIKKSNIFLQLRMWSNGNFVFFS